jgi:hypothetical protein
MAPATTAVTSPVSASSLDLDVVLNSFLAGDLGSESPAEPTGDPNATPPETDPLAPAQLSNAAPGEQLPAASHAVRLLLVGLLLFLGLRRVAARAGSPRRD